MRLPEYYLVLLLNILNIKLLTNLLQAVTKIPILLASWFKACIICLGSNFGKTPRLFVPSAMFALKTFLIQHGPLLEAIQIKNDPLNTIQITPSYFPTSS